MYGQLPNLNFHINMTSIKNAYKIQVLIVKSKK